MSIPHITSRKNLTKNRRHQEGHNRVKHKNKKEIDRSNRPMVLYGKKEAKTIKKYDAANSSSQMLMGISAVNGAVTLR